MPRLGGQHLPAGRSCLRRTHRCRASLVTARNGCSIATPALFTSSSKGPAALTAASVASQSARSTHSGVIPGHYGEGSLRGRGPGAATGEPGGSAGSTGERGPGGAGTSLARLSRSAAVRLSAVT